MSKIIYSIFFAFITLFLFQSCSLVKIESEQKPLPVLELNTRLLTQSYVNETCLKVEKAVDSILNQTHDLEIKKNALKWKLNTVRALKKTGFQTTPKLALLDTWALMFSIDMFFKEHMHLFKNYAAIPKSINEENLIAIESIGKTVLKPKEFIEYKAFIEDFSTGNPIHDLTFYQKPIRESFNDFKKGKDSISVQTVGSLSEVMADLNNNISFTSKYAGKELKWNTELFLNEKGIDSIQIQKMSDSIQKRFDRLVFIAEQSPELLDKGLKDFQQDLIKFSNTINSGIHFSMNHLSKERAIVADIIKKERKAVDSLVLRERKALTKEAEFLSKELLDHSMNHLKDIIKTILAYLIALLAIIIFLPFIIGYYTGKTFEKNKKLKS